MLLKFFNGLFYRSTSFPSYSQVFVIHKSMYIFLENKHNQQSF